MQLNSTSLKDPSLLPHFPLGESPMEGLSPKVSEEDL